MMWGSGAVLCHAGLGNKNHSPCWTDWNLTAVFRQLPSVIAEKQNGRVVRNTAGLQGVEQPANLLIHQSDSVEVLEPPRRDAGLAEAYLQRRHGHLRALMPRDGGGPDRKAGVASCRDDLA